MSEQKYVNANPTKEFFIDMLTRDIRLDRAIIDLIDNSIDGAKNISNNDYSKLNVSITVSSNEFEIRDNCGGFPLEVAKNYAFKFGRPPSAKFVDHSIGRFGVGMKRALFKMGKSFTVESKCKNDHFLVDVNTTNWLTQKDGNDWGFTYFVNGDIPKKKKKIELDNKDGTVITVSDLYESISEDFNDDSYLLDLQREISLALNYSLLKGLTILLNGLEIKPRNIDLLLSNQIKPYFKEIKHNGVLVKIYAGIGKPDPNVVGWYIFCNDRLVLEADTSNLTGWRETPDDEESGIVKYNNKHAMFRGIVHFSADDSKKLPMTTTKTGIDSDHPIYKMVKPAMKTALRQVTTFTNQIKDKEERNEIIANSKSVQIAEINPKTEELNDKFIGPDIEKEKKINKHVSICFSKDRNEVEKLKEYFGVSKNYEVGEKMYDYFMNMKGDEI